MARIVPPPRPGPDESRAAYQKRVQAWVDDHDPIDTRSFTAVLVCSLTLLVIAFIVGLSAHHPTPDPMVLAAQVLQ